MSRISILAVTLLSLVLGGATQLWEQALLALLMGGLIFLAPPGRSLGLMPNLLLGGVLLLAVAAFLPAGWGGNPSWRTHLTEDLNLPLAGTRTPQPWLTAQSCGLLFMGLAWIAYVLSQRWTSETRLSAARCLVLGVATLAALALAAFCFDFHVPNWNQEENRGWFPNRNQTADVLALCAVVNYAIIFDCLRKRRASLYLWLVTLAVLDAALVVSYSRAGILMFFGGLALWHLWPVEKRRGRNSATKWMALGLALVSVLLTLFFLFGGQTLERFEGPLQSVEDNHFRWAIQQDAWHFSWQSPFLGVGLGNFEPLFASARVASINADRAIHPESDWLWAVCELGWMAPVLFLAGIGWWLRRCFPFRARAGESLRRALTVAGVIFVLHGFVDVSAHRIGSLFVGLLVFSLATPSLSSSSVAESRGTRAAFRGLALAMLALGGWWLASVAGAPVPPTTAELDRTTHQIDEALAANDLPRMEILATSGLQIAPLSWHLHFQRAFAETFLPGQFNAATRDFMVARSLESKWVKPCFDEGVTWLAAGQPDLCLDAWEESLQRAPTPEEALDLYHEMLERARGNEMVHGDLLELAGNRIDYQLEFLSFASPEETKAVIGKILAKDANLQTLNGAHRKALFDVWWEQGDKNFLIDELATHPDWLKSGWFFAAQAYAKQKNYEEAWTTIDRYAPPPVVPNVSSERTVPELQTAFYDQSDNLAAGLLLYLAQNREGRIDDALTTLRVLEKNKNCPPYIFYLEAKLWGAKQQWELAWNAWWSFHQA